jgi:hypothetical protein
MEHVGWCDWPVTQNSRYWHHKSCNISCLNSHFLSQFMLKWNLYQHICLSAFVCYWCLLITSSFENLHLPLNNHDEVSGLIVKSWSVLEGKPKYRWSVSRAFTVWIQAQHGTKIECALLQSVRLCDDVWQTVVCGLSVVFNCRRYWLLLYSLHSYCNSIQNHIPYYKFITGHCALYTRVCKCCSNQIANFPTGIKHWGPANLPQMPFPQFSPAKGSLCNCTISLGSYTGVYVNRWLIVYQQLHCAVFS